MAAMTCPSCGCEISPTAIPTEVLQSERGRRNSRHRKSFKGRPKGQPLVWRAHLPGAARCWCGPCRLGELDLVEAVLLRRKGLGTKPWVDQELDRLHKTRTAVEAVVNARELKDEVVAIAA